MWIQKHQNYSRMFDYRVSAAFSMSLWTDLFFFGKARNKPVVRLPEELADVFHGSNRRLHCFQRTPIQSDSPIAHILSLLAWELKQLPLWSVGQPIWAFIHWWKIHSPESSFRFLVSILNQLCPRNYQVFGYRPLFRWSLTREQSFANDNIVNFQLKVICN